MSIPLTFAGLVDDAAIFPPGLMPLEQAVEAHAAHISSAHADLVGPFIVDAARLDALFAILRRRPDLEPMRVSVVVPSPASVYATVYRTAVEGLDLDGLEVKLDPSQPLARQVPIIASTTPDHTQTYIEAPRPGHPEWSATLEALSTAGLMLKFRTGGTTSEAFPDEREVATWLVDAVGAGVPFKCTAGLHQALRHTDPTTGFEHHGFLNVLMATIAAAEGAGTDDVARELARRDGEALATSLGRTAPSLVAEARRWFRSYGSCSILEPLDELGSHGLIPVIHA